MAAHRYWRMLISANGAGSYAAMAELQAFVSTDGSGTSDLLGTTTAASSTYSSGPSALIDGNFSNFWAANGGVNGEWVSFDLGAGVTKDLKSFTMYARNDSFANQCPSAGSWQYSDDNSAWTTAFTFSGTTTPAAALAQTFPPVVTPAPVYVSTCYFDTTNKSSNMGLSGAYSSPGLPTLVQRANNRIESGGSLTVTLASAPTSGNLLVAMITGFPGVPSGGSFPTPAGWTRVFQDTSTTNYQGGAIFTRTVVADPAATAFSVNGIPAQCTVFEFSSAGPVSTFSGAGSSSLATQSSPVVLPANTLGYLSQEQDNQIQYSSVTGPATLLYNNTTATNNHAGVTYALTGSGTVVTTYTANVTYPFFIGFVIGNASSVVYPNTVAASSGAAAVAVNRAMSGLSYAEFVITTLTGTPVVGIVNTQYNMSTATLLGGDANSLGYRSGGAVVANGTTLTTLVTFVVGDRIDMAVDPLNQLVWFRVNGGNWNNDVIANQNPVGAVGGISAASVIFQRWMAAVGASVTGTAVTAHFLAASFVGTVPTGYSSILSVGYSRGEAQTSNYNTPPLVAVTLDAAATTMNGNGNTKSAFSPAGAITVVSGTVKENSVAVVGRRVDVYDRDTGDLIGTTLSGAGGAWSLPTVGRPKVRIVGSDPTTYNSIVYDNVAGV